MRSHFKRVLADEVGGVFLADVVVHLDLALRLLAVAGDRLLVDDHLPVIVPDRFREIRVGDRLAVVAEEVVEALVVRVAGGADRAEPPLAHRGGGVAGLLKFFGDGEGIGGDRVLATVLELWKVDLRLQVAADLGVAEVFAGHQDAARGGADRRPGVVAGEAQPLAGEAVDVGGADLLLSVAAELAIAEVVGEDEDEVRPGSCPAQREADEGG